MAALLVALAARAEAQNEADPRFEPRFTYSKRRGVMRHKGLVTLYYEVGHQRGKLLMEYLNRWKSDKGQLWENEQLHLLSITDTEENIKILEQILEMIDTPEPQVMIEAKIVEVTYDNEFQWGGEAEWFNPKATNTFFRRVDERYNPDAFLNALAARQDFQGTTFDFRVLGHEKQEFSQVRATLRTLVARGNAEILSSPRLLVTSGHPAEILTGQKVPIQDVRLQAGQTFVTTRFEDVGIKLKVTPHLVGKAHVDMDVFAEVSAVTGFTTAGPISLSNPIISTRSVKTRVGIRDGETLIIGGLLKNETIVQERGVPILSDIPLVGYLFKSYRRTQAKQELIFFLTPYVRRSPAPAFPPRSRP